MSDVVINRELITLCVCYYGYFVNFLLINSPRHDMYIYMDLIEMHRQCKDILHCQLITIIDLLEKFDFYYNHI